MKYRISELAKAAGLSRSTLLYYEKKGLIKGKRGNNGYRYYSDSHLQRLFLLKQLQAGGLTLDECHTFLEAKIDRQKLFERLEALDQEIQQKQQARQLLAALLGQASMRSWHQMTDQLAPDAHLDWLQQQGFNEKNALHIKWLSKDMNNHDSYMSDFMTIFQTLERWAPGSNADSLQALNAIPGTLHKALDIGCGKGFVTCLLAHQTSAEITSVDNEESALKALKDKLAQQGLSQRVRTLTASMTELPLPDQSYDLLWSEGSAYIMGFQKALSGWKRLLTDKGYMVISDLVWQTDNPSLAAEAFWKQEYPDMQNTEKRVQQIEASGYKLIRQFPLSTQAWDDYYQPLKRRVQELLPDMAGSTAVADIQREIRIYEEYLGEFGYQMFVLQKN